MKRQAENFAVGKTFFSGSAALLTALCLANAMPFAAAAAEAETDEPPALPGLEYESAVDLQFAECFDVYKYSGGYTLLDIHGDRQYLAVPPDGAVPEGLDGDIVVLQKPLDHIYLAATAVMSLFDAVDSVDAIRLSGTNAGGWYIDRAVEAMENGDMLFAGKYDEPDYELLVNEGCDVAIESTMILHSPKVQEMLELMDIPVLIDRSSYETHPLGRTEWVKFYGALMDKEAEADAFFEKQAEIIEQLKDFPNTEKTVAFFYVSTDGSVVVRKPTDYIPRMVEIAGGRYVPGSLAEEETMRSSIPMTMEEFYAAAVDADYLIYNATIDDPIESMDDLLARSELFRDFKAVREGNVWCAGKYLYQATDIVGNMIGDIHAMLTGGDESAMTFLTKIE